MHATTRLFCLTLLAATVALPAWRMLGPFGGSVQGVRLAPSQPATIVVYTRDAQVFASHDRGVRWAPVSFPAEYHGVMHAFAIDPQNPRLWLAGVEDETGRASGVYRTTDAGEHWEQVAVLKGEAVWSLAMSAAHPGLAIAGTAKGVYRSSDSGSSWTRISAESYTDLRPVVSLAIDPRNADRIFAGTTHLPWRTSDGGKTWQSIHSGMLDDSDVFSVVIHPGNSATVYASACSGAYRSASGGTRWVRLATPKGTFRTYVVAVDPAAPTTVYAGTSGGLLRSENEGRTWEKISPHAVYAVDFEPGETGRIYFASTTGGILASDDRGKRLHELNAGFGNRQWIALVQAKSDLFAVSNESGSAGLYKSSDLGKTWSRLNSAALAATRLLAATPAGVLYAATPKQVLKSADGGQSWTPVGSLFSTSNVDALAISNDAKASLIVAAGERLLRLGAANQWQPLKASYTGRVRAISAADGILTVTTRSGVVSSKDSGATWEQCRNPATDVEWYDAARTPQGELLGATSHGLFRSADCADWSLVRSGLDASTVSTIYSDRVAGILYAGQGGVLYRSADGGATWTPIGGGSRSMPTRLALLPDHQDRIFGLFSRRGVAEWLLTSEPPASSASDKPSDKPGAQ